MPRIMLTKQQTKTQTKVVSNTSQAQQTQQMNKLQIDRMLRNPRSKEYMEALRKLDVGGHTHNKAKVDEIIDTIRNEFPEVEIQGIMLGIVSTCYLGKPYEVHTLDVAGQIIEHYQVGQELPNGMEKARSIALRGGYDFIEVYVDCCRAVSSSGAVSVIPY